jgi:aminoglycoside 2''-phosphotransferase
MYRRLTDTQQAFEYRHLEQIKKAFPELEVEDSHFYTDGFANDIVMVNDRIVFRFPKYQWVLDDLFGEQECLKAARLHTSMRLPEWTVHDKQFISYQKIPGAAMHQWRLFKEPQEIQMQAAVDLGTFLREIHSIPSKELKKAGIRTSVAHHSYDDWLKFYDDVQQELYVSMSSQAQDWCDTLFRTIIADNTLMDFHPKFIMGEFSSSHILFDREKKVITGIVDFRSAGIGDPAFDIAFIYHQYGQQFVDMMQSTYEGSERLLRRARFIAETFTLQYALGGMRTGNPYWYLMHLGGKMDFQSVYYRG